VNKLLSKLGTGLHKPDKQTLVFPTATDSLLSPLPIERLSGLGGQFGKQVGVHASQQIGPPAGF
jgi:DNA polymerase eta